MELGAIHLGGGRCRFRVWAPRAKRVEVHLVSPGDRVAPLEPAARGYHEAVVEGVRPGARYFYRLDGKHERPDPASRFQPEGVHGPSEVTDPAGYRWRTLGWRGRKLDSYIFYELHVGCFTPEGTFDAACDQLDSLRRLGVTCVEVMPVAQFPGARNWGYDGAYPFAVQASYGGPEAMKRFVDAAHSRGLAVALDVVYNHLGPEGNYLAEFGPYFTDRYHTPWGPGINTDGPHSDDVRAYFIANACYWVREFRIDALRLDAVQAIVDTSALPFLAELADAVHAEARRLGRRVYLIPESDANDPRLVRPRRNGRLCGYGLDAVWNDDFHHAVHSLLTGERNGYYADFTRLEHLARGFREGFIQSGTYSEYRRRRHGQPSADLPARSFVVFAQNHDQVGNRHDGARFSQMLDPASLRLAAGVVLLSPFLPLLFMGEEYGETAPFQFFTSHADPQLIENVRRGRREEFAAFGWKDDVPDPQDVETFLRSKLDRRRISAEPHARLLALYRQLIRLRKRLPALARLSKDPEALEARADEKNEVLTLVRRGPKRRNDLFVVFHFGLAPRRAAVAFPAGRWGKLLDSEDAAWTGEASAGRTLPDTLHSTGRVTLALRPRSFALYARGAVRSSRGRRRASL